ncbi:MAG: carbohydrate binding domain-containing protein [Candidatus Omnitrophica bacterium]|nr:carbohydrate binding domain-containing protein [Candidatus Omnitrophota bacterium]MDD5237986.1 carbohydrate binding domain-containing protein [Candidatus Omnitrophota bacterium]
MKGLSFCIFLLLCFVTFSFAQDNELVIDGFEVEISGGPEGTLDFGAGNGSSVEVTAATDIKNSGNQAIKVTYDAVSGGYMWVARGFNLDSKNAGWLVKPEAIDWKEYSAISFYMYGSDSKAKIAFDLKDNGNEMWRFLLEDNFKGWKRIVCPFNEFFARGDWQPDSSDKNATMDFPLKSYQFEVLPPAKGALYFDDVKLVKK